MEALIEYLQGAARHWRVVGNERNMSIKGWLQGQGTQRMLQRFERQFGEQRDAQSLADKTDGRCRVVEFIFNLGRNIVLFK